MSQLCDCRAEVPQAATAVSEKHFSLLTPGQSLLFQECELSPCCFMSPCCKFSAIILNDSTDPSIKSHNANACV